MFFFLFNILFFIHNIYLYLIKILSITIINIINFSSTINFNSKQVKLYSQN
uniref:Uncharacterized protein n=1 Tax=Siphoviridae sp. ctLqe90 TaxID=2825456 RepID=A0A8S5Q331_9CAUD|nr:MAG TPA: hypothetical protein [Siphoviridae sp. ctLqe90]